eukprot:6139386-Prymnesium_polylepis.1
MGSRVRAGLRSPKGQWMVSRAAAWRGWAQGRGVQPGATGRKGEGCSLAPLGAGAGSAPLGAGAGGAAWRRWAQGLG